MEAAGEGDVAGLRRRLAAGGQDHVLRFWPELGAAERRALAAELSAMDVAEINRFFHRARGGGAGGTVAAGPDARLEPVPRDVLGSASRDRCLLPGWESRGRCGERRGAERGRRAEPHAYPIPPVRRAGGDRGGASGRAAAGRRAGHPSGRPLPQGHVRRGAAIPKEPLPPAGPAPAAAAAARGGAARHGVQHPLVSDPGLPWAGVLPCGSVRSLG